MQPEYSNKFKTKHFSFTPNSHCTYQEVKAYNNTLNHNYCNLQILLEKINKPRKTVDT